MMSTVARWDHLSEIGCHLLQPDRGSHFFGQAYAEAYDSVMASVSYASWVDYVEDIAREVDCHVTWLLDVACGTGTFAMLALDRGIEVIGVDASPPMIERFRRKLRNHPHGSRCRIIESPLATFEIGNQVDAAVCFFDSLNYIVSEAQFVSTLCQISNALRPGGFFVFDVNNEIAYKKNLFQQSGRVDPRHGSTLDFEWLGQYCAHHSLYQLDLSFIVSNNRETRFRERHIQRFYPRETIEGHLAATGFVNIRCFRAFSFEQGNAFDERWSFVATKN